MRFLSANRVFDGRQFLPEGTVLVLNKNNSFVEFLSPDSMQGSDIERHEGILCPGFVNAHCHLELSHLKGKLRKLSGLPAFAREVISSRGLAIEETKEHMLAADKEMFGNGVVAVGDISNLTDSAEIKVQSPIHYHTFVEVLGLHPDRAETSFANGLKLLNQFKTLGLSASLAPHAPYSCSPALIEKIAVYDQLHASPMSIHNQESEEEMRFFMNGEGGFKDLYDFLQMNISWFKPPATSSLHNYARLLKGSNSILVHNTFTQKGDIDLVADNKTTYWCFCPQANLFIEGCLPHYPLFKNLKNNICIGTDSLASNECLDLVREVNTISNHSNEFSLQNILAMLTHNGAAALGLQNHYGSFIAGKNSGINLITQLNNKIKFIKKIC